MERFVGLDVHRDFCEVALVDGARDPGPDTGHDAPTAIVDELALNPGVALALLTQSDPARGH